MLVLLYVSVGIFSAGLILGTPSYIGHFRKTFPEHFVSLYYGRHLNADEVHTILQAYAEGSSLRGISQQFDF
jgi:hypothetical protein